MPPDHSSQWYQIRGRTGLGEGSRSSPALAGWVTSGNSFSFPEPQLFICNLGALSPVLLASQVLWASPRMPPGLALKRPAASPHTEVLPPVSPQHSNQAPSVPPRARDPAVGRHADRGRGQARAEARLWAAVGRAGRREAW